MNSKSEPDVYYMVEKYANRDAFLFHMKSPHFKKFSPLLGEYTVGGPMKFLAPVHPKL